MALVGFGSYQGRVIAGREWGAPLEELPVPPGKAGSWENLLHLAGEKDGLLLLPQRYDAFLYLDETRPLHPLHIQPEQVEPP